jgi:hypothetical protein
VLEAPQGLAWNRRSRDAVVAVAPGDDVAVQRYAFTFVLEGEVRLLRVDVVELYFVRFKYNLSPSANDRFYQVAKHFVLRINRNRAAARETAQVNSVRLSVEAQVDAVVDGPLAEQARADAAIDQQIHGALFETPARTVASISLRERASSTTASTPRR